MLLKQKTTFIATYRNMFGLNNFAHATPERWNELMLALQIMQVTCKYSECCYVCFPHFSIWEYQASRDSLLW